MLARARRNLLRAGRIARSRRALHLSPEGATELLKRHLPVSEASTESQGSYRIRCSASRQLNVPIIEIKPTNNEEQSVVLQLDVGHDTIPNNAKELLFQSLQEGSHGEQLSNTIQQIYHTWLSHDLLRLNATVHPSNAGITVSDVEAIADDFALKRQPDLRALEDDSLIHPLERQARQHGLFYHKSRTGGNIGCYGYGAGVAMSTMDALVAAGGKPANFLDGGGGATEANVRAAMDVILADPDVDVMFINSFGGLTKTDLIAKGVVEILREKQREGRAVPRIVIRLRGTGEAEARRILAEASDLPNLTYMPDLKEAAAEAVRLSGGSPPSSAIPASSSTSETHSVPVTFSQDGQYARTAGNLRVSSGDSVMIVGVGKASQFHNKVAQDFGTNIIGACAPGKGGQTFLSQPVFGDVREGVDKLKPRIASVFVPPVAAADSIIECIEAEVPLVVAYAEGIPTKDQLRVQKALRSQSKTRLIGANCPGVIYPHQKVKLGIQPLSVHSPGIVGVASRSGTISYELAAQTTALGLGQSVVFGLGGDPFPGTRTWEALRYMLDDPLTKVICLVGEVGGQMEEEAAEVYEQYLSTFNFTSHSQDTSSKSLNERPKPVVGFIAGESTQRGLTYGHAGAVWWDEQETAAAKKRRWEKAGFVMAPTLGDLGGLIGNATKEVA